MRNNFLVSRKGYHIKCRWWDKTTFNGQIPSDRLAYKVQPSGYFVAKPITDYSFQTSQVADIRVGSQFVTIESPDDLSMLRPDDLVSFQNILYRIERITPKAKAKTTQFMRNPIYIYVLQLVR